MALNLGRRKPREETAGGHGGRCRHFHVHYHLPRKRACTFSLLRWLPRPSLLSCVLVPLALFFTVLAFVVSFVWFTLLYFLAYLLSKDSGHESNKNGSFDRASGDVENRQREDGGQEGKREKKGKAVKHAAELLAGDSATAESGAKKLEIKELYVDEFSQVSRNIKRIASSDAFLNCEMRTNNDRDVEELSIFDTSREGMNSNAHLEEFAGRHGVQDVPVDGFMGEHIRLVCTSTSGDSLPSVYSINSAQIHDLPDMNEVVEMSSDFVVGSNQNMVVPSSHNISDTNEEYGEEVFEDRKELSDCPPYKIIDFIDKHETRDQALDSSSAKDEIVGLLTSSAGSAHGWIPDEHNKESTEEKDAGSVPEWPIDNVTDLEPFDEQRVADVLIMDANTNQSVAASNENETSELSLCSACEDAVSSDVPSHHDNGYEDDKQEEAAENNIAEASDPASVACDLAENHHTETRALDDDSVNGDIAAEVVSRGCSEDEAHKVKDNSASDSELNLKGAPRGRPLRRSPSQWWNLCGVVDVFAGSQD